MSSSEDLDQNTAPYSGDLGSENATSPMTATSTANDGDMDALNYANSTNSQVRQYGISSFSSTETQTQLLGNQVPNSPSRSTHVGSTASSSTNASPQTPGNDQYQHSPEIHGNSTPSSMKVPSSSSRKSAQSVTSMPSM